MKPIGIICASDTELTPFFEDITTIRIDKKAMLIFHIGILEDKEIILLYSGVCKVNAAIATQILIDEYHVCAIINSGTAGGIANKICLFDTIISTECAYHDVAEDILTEFHPWMNTIYFPCDPQLLEVAKSFQKVSTYPIHFGRTVSGEQFIRDEQREQILQQYAPLSTDMESAAVAHVCYVNEIPFLSVRTITDTASHIGLEYFEQNCETASHISERITYEILIRYLQIIKN